MTECTCPADKMPFGRCCKAPTSSDVIAGLEMALAQAAAMIERQQHVMQRAMPEAPSNTHCVSAEPRREASPIAANAAARTWLIWNSTPTAANTSAAFVARCRCGTKGLTSEFTGLRGFLRRSGGMMGWAAYRQD